METTDEGQLTILYRKLGNGLQTNKEILEPKICLNRKMDELRF